MDVSDPHRTLVTGDWQVELDRKRNFHFRPWPKVRPKVVCQKNSFVLFLFLFCVSENGVRYSRTLFTDRITFKLTSDALLVALVEAEQDCFRELFEAVDITRRISLSSSGCSVFQTVGPATGKARGRPYVLSRQRGTMSRCRVGGT